MYSLSDTRGRLVFEDKVWALGGTQTKRLVVAGLPSLVAKFPEKAVRRDRPRHIWTHVAI